MRCDATHVLPRTLHKCQILPLRTCCYATVWGRPASSAECPPIDARGVCRDRHEKRGGGFKRHEKGKKKKKWIRRVACVSTCLAFLSKTTTNKERRKEGIGPLIVEASRLLRLRVVLTLTHTRIHKTRFLHSSRQYSVYFSYKSSGSTREMKRLRNAPSRPLSHCPLRSGPSTKDMAFETHEYLPWPTTTGELFASPKIPIYPNCHSVLCFRARETAASPMFMHRHLKRISLQRTEMLLECAHVQQRKTLSCTRSTTSISLLSMTKRSCQAVVSPEEKNKKKKKNTVEQPVTSARSRQGCRDVQGTKRLA